MRKINILKIFWPEICPFCGKTCRQGICPKCRKKIDRLRVKEPKCMKCGKPVRYREQEYCGDCVHTHHYYDKGIALWIHKEPVKMSIYQFKFHNQRNFGTYYAKEIARECGKEIQRWSLDMMIPIPLHFRKRWKRGYNQAEVLAKELEKILGIPVNKKILRRIQYTTPQKKLNPKKRKKNLSMAFEVKDKQELFVKGKKVLLVDDIYTTGSTVDAAAKILKKAGAEKVYYLAISIGQGY